MKETAIGREAAPSAPPSSDESKLALTADEIISRMEVSMMGEATTSQKIDIRNLIAAGELTEEKRKEILKAIVEKHMMESTKLESELRQTEVKEINELLEDIEKKKDEMASEIKKSLVGKLRSASEDEREEIILQHAKELQDAANALELEKQQRLKDKRKKLKDERMKRKRELMRFV